MKSNLLNLITLYVLLIFLYYFFLHQPTYPNNIREKWSLFDESTHVPLIISHPLSPFKGQRYSQPVELIDIFPTINDLLAAPYSKKQIFGDDVKFTRLQGKSLAPIILGNKFRVRAGPTNNKVIYNGDLMPSLNHTFALSQAWRCAKKHLAYKDPRSTPGVPQNMVQWDSCSVNTVDVGSEVSLMGYSMRTLDFRYTMYIPFLRPHRLPVWDDAIFAEELYDHRGDKGKDNFRKETLNLATNEKYSDIIEKHRLQLRDFLWNNVVYVNLTTTFRENGKTVLHKKIKKSGAITF